MSAEKPDYHDADLMLRVYEMRREAKTREHRDQVNFGFWPKSFDDIKAIQQSDHPMNAAWRQLAGYWELVYGLARHGIVNADYLAETNGEALFHFAKIEPFLEDLRAAGNPTAFQNVEWVAKNCETGKAALERLRGMIEARKEADG